MASDDDILTGPVPLPDDQPTATERAHAKTFAELVEKTLAGRTPPAMGADDRALLEVATVIRAASGNPELPAVRRAALVEDAMRQAGGLSASASDPGAPRGRHRRGPYAGVKSSEPAATARARHWVPWAVSAATSLVAAAALVLWLGAPARVGNGSAAAAASAIPRAERSRPADAVVGPIARERAGDAGARIDAIFADRLDGYRELRFGGAR